MDARTLDRRAGSLGGRFVAPGGASSPAALAPRGAAAPPHGTSAPWAFLALSDGTLWRGQSIGAPGPTHGTVRVVGDLVLVEGETVTVMRDLEPVTPGARLGASLDPGGERYVVGFAGATGATLPMHGSVACAIARGEIGRP
jgi:hypothetical protein